MILKAGGDSIQKVESELTKIIDSDVGRDEKFHHLFSLMAEGHAKSQSIMAYKRYALNKKEIKTLLNNINENID